MSAHSFCSRRSSTGSTSPVMNSLAVCSMRRCSSVIRSRVIMVAGEVSATSHSPPRMVCAACVMTSPCYPSRSKIPAAPMPPPTHIVTNP